MMGVGTLGLAKGDEKDILTSCWELCQLSHRSLLGHKDENAVVAWANEVVDGASIVSLKDKSLSDGVFLM